MLNTTGRCSVPEQRTEGADQSDRPDLENRGQSQWALSRNCSGSHFEQEHLDPSRVDNCQELWSGSKLTLSAEGI